MYTMPVKLGSFYCIHERNAMLWAQSSQVFAPQRIVVQPQLCMPVSMQARRSRSIGFQNKDLCKSPVAWWHQFMGLLALKFIPKKRIIHIVSKPQSKMQKTRHKMPIRNVNDDLTLIITWQKLDRIGAHTYRFIYCFWMFDLYTNEILAWSLTQCQ